MPFYVHACTLKGVPFHFSDSGDLSVYLKGKKSKEKDPRWP